MTRDHEGVHDRPSRTCQPTLVVPVGQWPLRAMLEFFKTHNLDDLSKIVHDVSDSFPPQTAAKLFVVTRGTKVSWNEPDNLD